MHRYIPISIPDDFEIGQGPTIFATIDSDLVDSTLTNFPVGIEIASTGWIAERTTDGWQNLHCTVDGTECYVEVDQWDVSGDKAILWVKVPSISSSADTQILISIGADNTTTYVGETGDAAAQNVWDNNYVAVYHMSQDPSGGSGAILDSTSNANNGTSAGTMTSGDLVDGGFGKAIDFDGTDDLINCGSGSSLADISNLTIDFYIKLDALFGDYDWSHFINKAKWFISTDHLNNRSTFGRSYSTYNGRWLFDEVSTSSFFHLVCKYDKTSSANDPTFYINSVSKSVTEYVTPVGTADSDASESLYIGNIADADRGIDGQISEVRISNTARSAAWIKATNAVLAKTLVTLS